MAVADGALGFWKALEEVFPATRHQRCWHRKAVNVLNKVPKTLQPAVKTDLKDIVAQRHAAGQEVLDDDIARVLPVLHAHIMPNSGYFQSPRRQSVLTAEFVR